MSSQQDENSRTDPGPEGKEPSPKNQTSEKVCRSTTKTVKFPPPPPKTPKKQERPGSTGVKADLKRDIFILVGTLCLMAAICWSINDIGIRPPGKERASLRDLLLHIKKMSEQTLESNGMILIPSNDMSAPNCSLFLSVSSIPGSGWGLFVGNDFQPGDVVAQAGNNFVPLHAANSNNNNGILVHPYSFLIKHHPVLANLNTRMWWRQTDLNDTAVGQKEFSIVASSSIRAGGELFLPFDLHPHSGLAPTPNLFDNVPLPSDYEIADEIIQDIVRSFMRKRGQKTASRTDIEQALKLLYNSMKKVNKHVAQLLPQKYAEYEKWSARRTKRESTALASMKNRSLSGLETHSKCLSYVKLDTTMTSVVATTTITQDSVVTPVPLLLLPNDKTGQAWGDASTQSANEQCELDASRIDDPESGKTGAVNAWASSCFDHQALPFFMCPLSLAAYMTRVDASKPSALDAKPANAEFQWASWNANNKASHKIPANEAVQMYPKGLTLEVIALETIEEGDEIRVGVGPGSSLPEELLPNAWK